MLQTFIKCWKVPEIRRRILFTLLVLALCRLAANIPCPGIQTDQLDRLFDMLKSRSGSNEVGIMLDLFTGGALQKFAIAGLGIMPYITASIVISLLTPLVPQLEKWRREGETGYQKITQLTRYLTVFICIFQGTMFATAMANPGRLFSGVGANLNIVSPAIPSQSWFIVQSVIVLLCGTMLLMWFGELITEKGIGQGASLIITIGIVARIPTAIGMVVQQLQQAGEGSSQEMGIVHVIILLAFFVLVTAAVVAITVAERRIPIQYARSRAGRGGMQLGQQGSFLPLRLNYANVMPIIFASTLLMIPGLILPRLSVWANQHQWTGVSTVVNYLAGLLSRGTISYMVIYAVLIIFFCFFWVSTQFNPVKIADELKRAGAYVPGYQPGQETADLLFTTMNRITWAGSVALTVIALLPMIIMNALRIPYLIAGFFGGTSLLIMVGVLLDT
ncbi:MAG: preprotein translocase subunit SecY, partial [Lentisphaerae bacterium]